MDSSAPLAPLSASNRGPLIIVATYILLTISLFAVTVKTWTRLSNARRLLATDWVMLAGAVSTTSESRNEFDTEHAVGTCGRASHCLDNVD